MFIILQDFGVVNFCVTAGSATERDELARLNVMESARGNIFTLTLYAHESFRHPFF